MHDAGAAQIIRKLVPDHPLIQIGRFEVLGPIGEGGYGIVFKARDPDLHRLVAIKLCLAGSERAAQSLTREAKLLAQLNHPNIVTVHELGRHDGDVFIAMEYVDGSNVSAFARGNPSNGAIIDVYRGVARGLAAAHEVPIVHGDVKPPNILLGRNGIPRVADFGLAKLHEPESAPEHGKRFVPSGTPAYMAPEVLRGQLPDALADQWSFCVSLWETFTGEPMFDGRSPRRVLKQIERRLGAKLEHAGVPAAVREVLRVGLSIDPCDRYPSMSVLADALDRLRVPAGAPDLVPAPDPEPPVDVVELMPVGEAPASQTRRGVFVVALLLLGALVGWLGRPSVDAPATADPVPLPAAESSCAGVQSGEAAEPDRVVRAACEMIRDGDFVEASDYWDRERRHRLRENEALVQLEPERARPEKAQQLALELAAATLPIAMTFLEQAQTLSRDRTKAVAAAALRWTLLTVVGPRDPDAARRLSLKIESRVIYGDMKTAARKAAKWAPKAAVGSLVPESEEIERRAGVVDGLAGP